MRCTVTWKNCNEFVITVVEPGMTPTPVTVFFTSWVFSDIREKIVTNTEIQRLKLPDPVIMMMSCVVFMIHYDRTREVTVQPLVDPVTSVVFTWSSSDTPNIDMSLNIAERNITFTVVYCTTVEVTVMVPRVKNVVELCVSDIVNQLEKAEKIRTGPRSVLVTLAGMIYSLYYIVTTPNAGCTQQEFKGFSVDM